MSDLAWALKNGMLDQVPHNCDGLTLEASVLAVGFLSCASLASASFPHPSSQTIIISDCWCIVA